MAAGEMKFSFMGYSIVVTSHHVVFFLYENASQVGMRIRNLVKGFGP